MTAIGREKIKGTAGKDPAAERYAATELRCRAEEQLLAKTLLPQGSRNSQESRQIVHELEVHQIELEMQNAELAGAKAELQAVGHTLAMDLRYPLMVIKDTCQEFRRWRLKP